MQDVANRRKVTKWLIAGTPAKSVQRRKLFGRGDRLDLRVVFKELDDLLMGHLVE